MPVSLVNVVAVVKDALSGEPLPGVTVEKLMGGKPSGVISTTDNGGVFNVPIISIDGLRISRVGYQSEDYLSGEFVAGTNTLYMVRDYKTLPWVVTSGKSGLLWVLGAVGLLWYFNKNKKRR